MDAILSGQASALAFIEGNDCYLVHGDEPEVERRISYGFLKYIFSGVSDVQHIHRADRKVVRTKFLLEVKGDQALRLVLILFDREESVDARNEALKEIEPLIADNSVREFVTHMLYSNCLPKESQPSEALAAVAHLPFTSNLLTLLMGSQAEIASITLAWDELPDHLFEDDQERSAFRTQAARRGVFFLLSDALTKSSNAVNLALLGAFSKLRDLPNHRDVINSWTRQFRGKSQDYSAAVRLASIRESEEAEKASRPSVAGKVLGGHAAYENVLAQQEAIVHQVRTGNARLARNFMDQLVDNQLRGGEPGLAAKTLCKMAQEANAYGQYSLQLEWAQRASELSPQDFMTYGHLADAFIFLNRFTEALAALQRAEDLGDPRFANTDRARILRLQGRLDEALLAYQKLIQEYGQDDNNAYAWKGYAEVLRDMAHLDKALVAYDNAVKYYPNDEACFCGRASVLASLGNMEEAKHTYDEVLKQNANSDIALNGKATVLKHQGKLSESLALFEASIARVPANPWGITGKASVLKEMRRFGEAHSLLKAARRDFPYEPSIWLETAEIFRDEGKLDEALEVYKQAVRSFPFNGRLGGGLANVYKDLGDLKEALRAYDENIKKFPYDVTSHYGRADLLKRLRNFASALAAYDEILKRWPEKMSEIRHRKAAILVVLAKYGEAEALLSRDQPRTAEDWIASHVLGMILLRTNRLKEAISHFERGLETVPFNRSKKYFKNALAIAYLRQNEFQKASNTLPDGSESLTNVLRLHAWAGAGVKRQAIQILEIVEKSARAEVVELGREIARRYQVRPEKPKRDESWIHSTECELVLLEAA